AELERVIIRSAALLDLEVTPPAAQEVASRSRGTPRIANRLLRRVRDWAEVRGSGVGDLGAALAALAVYQVDRRGLDRLDRAILEVLANRFAGQPVGLTTLAAAVGEEPDTIETVVEPFLLREGLIARTPRGRLATLEAYAHLGADPPTLPI
ncbi:MAG: Holliday junction branch migration DNA helicase RuvB, partial [Bifidobacteriaceae bacterium]|nr:Holliday junction branch migration DNA helicase RuvB [Bifidobacteriaceae bacterium]